MTDDYTLVIDPTVFLLFRVLRFTYSEERISEIDVIGDRTTLANLDLALMDN